MWIKICANTNLEDTLLAAELGADAVGFVFAPSPRQVTVEQAAEITPHLPPHIERIGVFPALEAPAIASAAHQAALTAVQLHGGVSLALLQQLHNLLDPRVKIIQTIHWQIDSSANSASAVSEQLREITRQGIAPRVLIDSKLGASIGGTGVSFDWHAARSVFSQSPAAPSLILAGGLHSENVAAAIASLTPWGVDVASGVESSPGKKNPEKLAAFIRNARSFA